MFLTDIDPNAKTKGSRDPLGTLGMWTGFGRRVVGNLTTQTTSLDDFRVLVIGCWLEDQVRGQVAFEGDAFLAWEQLCAYTRLDVLQETAGFRGVNKARRNLGRDRIDVSAERVDQLLTSQRVYGIWGLYRAAAWRCGLVFPEGPLVRHETLQVVHDVYLPLLEVAWGPGARELVRWVRSGHELRLRRDRDKLEAIAGCISGPLREAEADLYRDSLVHGGRENPALAAVQQELASALLSRVPADQRPSRQDVLAIAADARSPELREALEDIVACEAVLAPAAMCFSFLSQQDRTATDEVADRLAEHYADAPTLLERRWLDRLHAISAQRRHLVTTVRDEHGHGDDRWLAIADALHRKDFRAAVPLLIDQNTAVSRDRGASTGWVATGPNGLLQVHLADTSTRLRAPDEVGELWWNPYFLDTLHGLAHALREVAA